MIREKSLVAYKGHPGMISSLGDKIEIILLDSPKNPPIRVREKDVEFIHPGPVANPAGFLPLPVPGETSVREAWELLEGSQASLGELADLIFGANDPQTAWASYGILKEGLYFSGDPEKLQGKPASEVEAEEKKRRDKLSEQEEREVFLARLKRGEIRFSDSGDDPGEGAFLRFIQDVEALAYGKTDKSRTLRDLERPETPEEAHRILLQTNAWTPWINPYPARFGITRGQTKFSPPPLTEEDRLDLTGLLALAIDNPGSQDPDDAISLDQGALWVHVADPAGTILPGDPLEFEARGRGATLYLPEGFMPMLGEELLPRFALGLEEKSPALSFKISLDDQGGILETEIFPSWVNVTRLTYPEADAILAGTEEAAGKKTLIRETLNDLLHLGERNLARRLAAGGVSINFPEVNIALTEKTLEISPQETYRSAEIVRECMLLAGEGAAKWAAGRNLPFPYITQEAGDLPRAPLPGLAGSYQLRRAMRPRVLSIKPGRHWGLGLEEYSQVTSPLRRYTDLLAHQQIRAYLRRGAYGDLPPLDEDETLLRMSAGDAAAVNVVKAERASRRHWTMVYLSQRPESTWEGVFLERKANRGIVFIPQLGMETNAALEGDPQPNDPVNLTLGPVNLPLGEAAFRSF